ncbi:hypothetical protein GC102_23290 [Paenibacillus sp. LMG 31460]|uniref:Uncharacterized protein n=1 Tax=Paenibacillus germinis TaxID=2654979 RepID=A0ABX1Z8P2_9BACL|nr:hypothetical protein [Paenibacillus germinis]NOU88654.1 hypothetical protein [Paenibacillus germinis]
MKKVKLFKCVLTAAALFSVTSFSTNINAAQIVGNLSYGYLSSSGSYLSGGASTWYDTGMYPAGVKPVSMIAGVKLFKDGILVGNHQNQTVGGTSVDDYLDSGTHPTSSSYVLTTSHNWWWGNNSPSNEYREHTVKWPCPGGGSFCGPTS